MRCILRRSISFRRSSLSLGAQLRLSTAIESPSKAYLADRAFRHGDLENTLKELNKIVAGHHGLNFGAGAAGILTGLAGALKSAGGGTKFSSLDVKRVYLGNFLCDYSQAMDIAGTHMGSALIANQ